MQRTNPNFKEQTVSAEELNSFLDELFANVTDFGDINSDTDKVPDLSVMNAKVR